MKNEWDWASKIVFGVLQALTVIIILLLVLSTIIQVLAKVFA
jgi:hypothetical protein